MQLELNKIRIDGGTQPRAEIDNEIVTEYAQVLKDGGKFPPVVVFFDGVVNWLADGFHRFHGHRRAAVKEIEAEVKEGTLRDAVLYSVGANAAHGLRRSNADKRKAVETMLNDEEWGKWSNVQVAQQCGVSEHLVRSLRPSRSETSYVSKSGKPAVMNTANIGRTKPQPPEPDDVEDVEPEETEPEREPMPQVRGVGIRLAHEAIGVLKRIPEGDGLLQEAYDTVINWIDANR